MNIKERIEYLRKEISQHNHKYYVLDKPSVSDLEFDLLLRELEYLENKYPNYYDKNSPTQRVGGKVINGFASKPHKYKMLSLANGLKFIHHVPVEIKMNGSLSLVK